MQRLGSPADREPPKVISDSPEPGGAAGSHLVTERLSVTARLCLSLFRVYYTPVVEAAFEAFWGWRAYMALVFMAVYTFQFRDVPVVEPHLTRQGRGWRRGHSRTGVREPRPTPRQELYTTEIAGRL